MCLVVCRPSRLVVIVTDLVYDDDGGGLILGSLRVCCCRCRCHWQVVLIRCGGKELKANECVMGNRRAMKLYKRGKESREIEERRQCLRYDRRVGCGTVYFCRSGRRKPCT